MTKEEKYEAIKARIQGEYDNEQLQKIGSLSTTLEDIKAIIDYRYE